MVEITDQDGAEEKRRLVQDLTKVLRERLMTLKELLDLTDYVPSIVFTRNGTGFVSLRKAGESSYGEEIPLIIVLGGGMYIIPELREGASDLVRKLYSSALPIVTEDLTLMGYRQS